MQRNQHERHDHHESGRWAEIDGAGDTWLLTWSAARGPLEYRTPVAAREAALDWTERGRDPRRAQTLVQPVTPAGIWR